jgi:hypothetical protein
MKLYCYLLISMIASFGAGNKVRTYVGSTPAHDVIRRFLQIPLTDSIDFIRWKLEFGTGTFQLDCRYGISKAGTPGFSNEQTVSFAGQCSKSGTRYALSHKGRSVSILEVNDNVLHFLDGNNHMLIGNSGYSYALNSADPVEADAFNIRSRQGSIRSPMVFEGRTPCRDLAALLGLEKSEACNKMKWYFLFYTDSATGKPSYFLMGGIKYRKETMARGSWEIVAAPDGGIVYRLYSDQWVRPLNLLKGDDNILFFINAKGRLLVGNEDFSYTLNRRKEEYPRQ